MKPYILSLFNALTLIILSFCIYLYLEENTIINLIPLILIGVILLILNKGVKKEKKIPAHIAVVITLISFFILLNPFVIALSKNNTYKILIYFIMLLSTILALISFIMSFINVRKSKRSVKTSKN